MPAAVLFIDETGGRLQKLEHASPGDPPSLRGATEKLRLS
jgi:hypothetical protein